MADKNKAILNIADFLNESTGTANSLVGYLLDPKVGLLGFGNEDDFDFIVIQKDGRVNFPMYYNVYDELELITHSSRFIAHANELVRLGLVSKIPFDSNMLKTNNHESNPKSERIKRMADLNLIFNSFLNFHWLNQYVALPGLEDYIKHDYKTEDEIAREVQLDLTEKSLNESQKANKQSEKAFLAAQAISKTTQKLSIGMIFVVGFSAVVSIISLIFLLGTQDINITNPTKEMNITITNPVELKKKAAAPAQPADTTKINKK